MGVIRVFLHNFLDAYSEKGRDVQVEVQDGWQVKDVLEALDIQAEIIGVVLLNKELVSKDAHIKANDRIDLYPMFGGG
ncbi:MoaD/ThiS family protein [Dethiobacter alkaliphilus]|uniref:MoaD/ThiS family protein n=1 Tax=Dethiobacter alkaliphilus TaxID=427926 RepID=UPI0022278C06|nr:MoaD/ThiS family protein [Dethiobacter alkaliphilus]MCW3489411.1 MoaD/ThiS family protein [Dethiobacter alkaliphilus]